MNEPRADTVCPGLARFQRGSVHTLSRLWHKDLKGGFAPNHENAVCELALKL